MSTSCVETVCLYGLRCELVKLITCTFPLKRYSFSALSVYLISFHRPIYSQGGKTYAVPAKLHADNRGRLLDRLRAHKDVPSGAVVLLEGGNDINQYCTDIELVFRQVRNYVLSIWDLFWWVHQTWDVMNMITLMYYCLAICWERARNVPHT